MKKQYIKPVSMVSATIVQPILAGSGSEGGDSSYENSGNNNSNKEDGTISDSGSANEFPGGTGAKYNAWDEWEE